MAVLNNNIADDKKDELVLTGIQPRHQIAYRFFKVCRAFAIGLAILTLIAFILTFVDAFKDWTVLPIYRRSILYILVGSLIFVILMVLTKMIFLRKAPFDDWVYEISSKRLGTEVIFYDSKYIYIQYDRTAKEVDKKEFVTEMSDKSVHYSYFLTKTWIDRGVLQVECTRRQPIPELAEFSAEDDKYWNIIPLGLTVNNVTKKVAPIGWWLNDHNKNPDMVSTIISTSILLSGSTGCFSKDTPTPIYDDIIWNENYK